jgi:hypothetical protein
MLLWREGLLGRMLPVLVELGDPEKLWSVQQDLRLECAVLIVGVIAKPSMNGICATSCLRGLFGFLADLRSLQCLELCGRDVLINAKEPMSCPPGLPRGRSCTDRPTASIASECGEKIESRSGQV